MITQHFKRGIYMQTIKDYSNEELMLKLPLYGRVSIDLTWGKEKSCEIGDGYENENYTETSDEFQKLISFISESNMHIYGRCPKCNKKTYFTVGIGVKLPPNLLTNKIRSYVDSQIDSDYYIPEIDEAMDSLCNELVSFQNALFFDNHFACPKCQKIYKASFSLEYEKSKHRIILSKIGQYPSLPIVTKDDLELFDKILEKFNAKNDYKKAIYNNTNGDNIGAFVYLRRLIEKYINYTYKKHKNTINISETDFSHKKTIDKISCLKGFIPQLLIHNREIYSIVSLGIHELDEQKCNELYPFLKDVIDYVLSFELEKVKAKNITSNFQKLLRKEKNTRNHA